MNTSYTFQITLITCKTNPVKNQSELLNIHLFIQFFILLLAPLRYWSSY